MSAERSILTREQVNQAESRVGFSHPVLTTIERNLPRILHLNEGYVFVTDSSNQQQYIKGHYGFLADALVEAGPYPLEPIDLIAIWARVIEVFPNNYYRYDLAGMISSAYAVMEIEDLEWKKLPRHYFETGQLPEAVTKDRSGLVVVQSRLHQIGENLGDIDFYTDGVSDGITHASDLAKRERDGDEEAARELDALIAHQKAHNTPTLSELHENFGNGYMPLSRAVGKALKAFGREV
ncbi:hypothetical protein A3G67_00510 [Candidatus Roizmanbacteria bacterium RIFCSPLOWO2_12_FULL_40_12]|uniref:Uncharacterized protein n=1 Tax=Candidatus Roizmanbacteria bacterium RIFCSPLOWO2_01_FULL_40_42 TaxID=1802066 RepID=A0A1F7J656_9BACT|nr:MAG: hypothetical protein A2779_01990 [Candidatus Roizmanbacteria bacterium RIFCSPHIGHO2_01_FULL_40_98]OGK28764.1 MAG: hypothetical protein A3C31_03910 [Candidatus Roizmanbacteria bacterium RIFCSPHIGHO2_02_FULL_40_53]OGK29622.1 MAG: hypothetical protein A2W49_00305 [Candidatus Roizmanbacteria bacterium RIFCSPHIGHO2_12_41_18]OGK36343.1 MAG: hypothetical protein A3E69_02875 [Candidatus Roizmanbacteria bacterium RIFCSPHIGHO2_12_FULL_40_130]OGK51105.1 MAG: hypothetical protein A3B50_04885 [Candi